MAVLTRRGALALGTAALAAGCATRGETETTAAPVRGQAAMGDFGLELDARNLAVAPGDDFYRHAAGTWLDATQIPSDRTRWGSFDILADKAERDSQAILNEVIAAGGAPGTNAAKIKDMYEAYVDQDAIDARGLSVARPYLDAIAALDSHAACAALIGRPDMPVSSPIGTFISLDSRNPDRYVAWVSHGGLGLPEREYYRRTEGEFPAIREAYVAHIARMFELAGIADGAAKAQSILAFETQIAELHWPVAQRRERNLTYNAKSRAELEALSPAFPWGPMLDSAGLGGLDYFVVRELSAIGPLGDLFAATPVSTLKDYLTFAYLRNVASVLPRAFDEESFAFYGQTLNGQPEQRPRDRRAVQVVSGVLGEAIGQLYVARHFPPEAKRQMEELVENVRLAYGQRIRDLSWMTPETKLVALEKLAAFKPKIGYPDRWTDYSAMDVRPGDAYGNQLRAGLWDYNRDLERLTKPSDRDEWFMTPQTVNAYYNPTFNEIVFPAAILQAPFFDPNADPAVNYGGIGGVIGHEMGHGFDDQGAKSDARGVLRDWWNERDVAAFTALGDRLVAQYNAFEPLPGLNLNGRLGLGENIGDNGGLQVSYHAYQLSLNGRPSETLEGLTGDQRFFLSWAQIWRTLFREQRLRNQILTGPHSPPEFRCNGVVRNMDAWYAAFDVQPGQAMYLPPEERVKIW
jgi:putative endopeptidase